MLKMGCSEKCRALKQQSMMTAYGGLPHFRHISNKLKIKSCLNGAVYNFIFLLAVSWEQKKASSSFTSLIIKEQ